MPNWPEPTFKSEVVEQMLNAITGQDGRAAILSHRCTTCERPITCNVCNVVEALHITAVKGHDFEPFRDNQSAHEYAISGMCQRCQDEVFGTDDLA
jgi:hypothetical protein